MLNLNLARQRGRASTRQRTHVATFEKLSINRSSFKRVVSESSGSRLMQCMMSGATAARIGSNIFLQSLCFSLFEMNAF